MDYVIGKIKKQILDLVEQAVGREIDKGQLEITAPPESEMGDLALPCFYLSKLLRVSPNQIAAELKQKIKADDLIKEVQNVGPYLNFFLDSALLNQQILKEIASRGDQYGSQKFGQEKVMIEYSQPNTHKEFHIGHLRNALLGSSLVNLYRFCGFKVVAANYIGDVGAHVAKCLWALEKFHAKEELPENKGKYLGKIYTEAVRKVEDSEKFKQEADVVLQKLENGDEKWLTLWQKTRKWSLDEFNEIYKTLGIKFDNFFYESEVEKPGKKIVEELLEKKVAEKSDGAIIIDLEKYNLKKFLLLKSDGSSLYSTKDLALAQLKFKKFKIKESILVVDTRQNFYLQQLFKTLEVMGFKEKMAHIPYEFVTLKEGAMASRSGNVVLFEDFFEQIVAHAEKETIQRHKNWPEKKIKAVAKKIALSAIKFNMLKVNNGSIIVFDIDEALSFDGFSGPYLQYTLSRISSVVKKAGVKSFGRIDYSKLNTDLEKELILKLAEFPEAVRQAKNDNEPSVVTKYLFDLSRLFANFYQQAPILASESGTRQARLVLLLAVRQVLGNGLALLGIEPMEQM
jgi:arginyl-tRNA synthetase